MRASCLRLARLLLPVLDAASLEQAWAWTGLDFLAEGRLLRHLEEERERLLALQEEFAARPDYHADPRTIQELHRQEQERLQNHKSSLLPLLNSCHQHPRFARLLACGFGTSRYDTPFWRLSYYRDHAAAAELCQRNGKKNWAALLQDYQLATESFDILSERLAELRRTLPRTARQEWEAIQRQLDGLPSLHLQTAQSRLQLQLLKGGSVWEKLTRAELPSPLAGVLEEALLLRDQLDELRSQR